MRYFLEISIKIKFITDKVISFILLFIKFLTMEFIKPHIKLSHHVIVNEQGDVCIGEIPGFSKVVRNAPDWLIFLLEKLDGQHTVPRVIKDIEAQGYKVTEDEIINVINSLANANLLEDAAKQSTILTNEEVERYNRQILQFSLFSKSTVPGHSYQEKLKNSKIAVLGLGGWGTWVSLQMALLGIGSIRLVDGDEVELSNLNRQVLYNSDSIGKNKAQAAKDKINQLNPNVICEVCEEFVRRDSEQINRLLNNIDAVVLAWASLGYYRKDTIEEIVHHVSLEKGIKVIELGGDPVEITVGPIYMNDGNYKTYFECKEKARNLFYSSNENIQNFQKARLKNNYRNGNRIVNAWQSCPSLSIMAGIVADQLVKVLTGYDQPILIGKKFTLSLQTLESKIEILY